MCPKCGRRGDIVCDRKDMADGVIEITETCTNPCCSWGCRRRIVYLTA